MTSKSCELCQHKDVCKYADRFTDFMTYFDAEKDGLGKQLCEDVETVMGKSIPDYIDIGVGAVCKYYTPVLTVSPFGSTVTEAYV